jgi:hypothetical protein
MDSDRRDMAAAVVPSSTGSSHIAGVSNHILRLRCLESAEQVLSLSERPEKPLETKESGGCWPLPVSSTGQLDAEGAGSKADSGPGSGNLGCINQGRRIACGLKPPRIYSSPAAAETAKGDWVESRAEC